MPKRTPIVLAGFLASVLAAASTRPVTLVICAPGYPSNTQEAQPSMDRLADAVTHAAGWPASRLTAEYQESEQGGLTRIKATPETIALVPLPFYLAHAKELKLLPKTQAVPKGGEASETWSLVAKKGRVRSPASLSGWQIAGLPAYVPDFVRKVALPAWGEIPPSATFVPSGQVLSMLRRAASGQDVAVLLDTTQAAALPSLPFAGELEVVAQSEPLPAVVLCTAGSGLPAADAQTLVAGLLKMHESAEGAAALDAVRLARFVPLDDRGLTTARTRFDLTKSK
ncbi:MAG TPA: PhnD/SsuA/transferrin family substrate-binding protein [Candidatus Polarisedimenticolaceae bacterium]|nr:PhnD/SsuA/transferrin family substrate-binding protein [Candidatus Polarisedimenticolaceae bacterium]